MLQPGPDPQPEVRAPPASRLPPLSVRAPSLARLLGQVRARAARVELVRALGWGLAAAAGLLLLTVGLVALRFEAARTPGWVLAGLTLLAGGVIGLWRAGRVRRDDAQAARVLGRLHPADASDLLSAVELSRDPEASASLVAEHLRRMATRAGTLDPRPAVRVRPAVIALSVAAALTAVHLAGARWGGDRAKQAWGFLFFQPIDEATLFAPEPIAGDVTLTYRYPAHTGRAPKRVAGTAGDILAPKGTVVEIEAQADRDVERAFAVYGDTPIPMRVEGRHLSGELLVGASGEWRFRYATEKGRVVARGPARPVVVEADQPPKVILSAPEAELEVDGDERLSLSFEATDDYGLSQLSLVWSFGDGVEQRKSLQSFSSDLPRRHRAEATWDLSTLGLGPGDRVTYRVEALDNDSVSGVKRGASATQVLKVFSKVEHHREVLRRAQEQWERLLSGLGDRLVEPPAGARGQHVDAEWAKRTLANDQVLTSVGAGLSALAAELAQDERAPKEIGLALGNVGRRVAGAVRQTVRRRAAANEAPSTATAGRLQAALAEEIQQEEQGVLYLEDLFDRQRLLDLAELSRELQSARRELANLVEAFRQEPTDEARRKLMAEVSRLKQRVHDLFRRMQELQKQIQDRHLNQEAAEALDEGTDLLSELDKIQQSLAGGDTDAALKALEELQKQLEKLEQQFNEGAGEASPEMQEVGRKLQELASDLMDVEAEQQALRDETEKLQSSQREAQRKKLEELGAEFVKKQRDRVAKAAKELEQIDPSVAEMLVLDEEQQRALERLAQLDQALQGGDFDEALDQAEQALDHGSLLKRRLESETRRGGGLPSWRHDPDFAPAADHARRAETPMAEVVRDLDQLMRQAQPRLSDAQRQKLQELAKKQGEAGQRTEQLKQKLDEIGKQAPLFGPQEQAMLEEAQQRMGDAQGRLETTDPRGASAQQGKALEQLQAMRQAMQDAANQQGSGQGGGGIPMPFARSGGGEGDGQGQGMKQEKVEIPTADQSRAPEAFRKDILDAMKDETPEAYRERVRNYYEELVK